MRRQAIRCRTWNSDHLTPTIGSLSVALSLEQRPELGITHIVSVCPEYPSTGPNHLTIPIVDSEYADILIHLPVACRFVQSALDQGGRVLVHCVMGISRSTTIVAAYREHHWTLSLDHLLMKTLTFAVMKTRQITASAAIRFIRQCASISTRWFLTIITSFQVDHRWIQTPAFSNNLIPLRIALMSLHLLTRPIFRGRARTKLHHFPKSNSRHYCVFANAKF